MFSTILKISVRNLLKQKMHVSINVFGLALGFTVFIVIGLFFQFELSWDQSNENYDRIYRVQRHYAKTMYAMDGNDISPHSRAITAQLLEKQFPEFEKLTVIRESSYKIYHVVNRTILFFTVCNICLAMIGLVSFTVFRRPKEIGVRKINGSTSVSIFYLLSREYFVLMIYALLIAVPGAWWVYE